MYAWHTSINYRELILFESIYLSLFECDSILSFDIEGWRKNDGILLLTGLDNSVAVL